MNALRRTQRRLGRRLPMMLQTEAAECGLACLAMIVAIPRPAVRPGRAAPPLRDVAQRGATLKDLVRIADQLGLASRPLRLELDELPHARGRPASCTGT